MTKTKHTPIWVYLAFSSIETRKGAIILIALSLLFTLYCIPWALLFHAGDGEIVSQVFLIDDWSWFGMMLPVIIWYLASLLWMDRNDGWTPRPAGLDT